MTKKNKPAKKPASTPSTKKSNGHAKPAPAAVATPPKPAAAPVLSREERIKQAKQKGYEGDPCSECGQLTLVRSGACAKCDTCGATSGCS